MGRARSQIARRTKGCRISGRKARDIGAKRHGDANISAGDHGDAVGGPEIEGQHFWADGHGAGAEEIRDHRARTGGGGTVGAFGLHHTVERQGWQDMIANVVQSGF